MDWWLMCRSRFLHPQSACNQLTWLSFEITTKDTLRHSASYRTYQDKKLKRILRPRRQFRKGRPSHHCLWTAGRQSLPDKNQGRLWVYKNRNNFILYFLIFSRNSASPPNSIFWITLFHVTSTHHRWKNDSIFGITTVSLVANFVGNHRDVDTSEKVGKPVIWPGCRLYPIYKKY